MKSKKIFISGIDTDCGKTYITQQLYKKYLDEDKKVITSKPIQTGCKNMADDIIEHRKKVFQEEDFTRLTNSYLFEKPCSPHLAAKLENIKIDVKKILSDINELAKKFDIILMEGAGGLMVPINENFLTIDLIKMANFELFFVTNNRLGSINHTLLSLEAIKKRKINLTKVFFNDFKNLDREITEDSFCVIKNYIEKNFKNRVKFIREIL